MRNLDIIATLLAAAANAPDREMALTYLAESRIMLAREGARLEELRLLLDAREGEYLRTGGAP
jgi:hypothetical protein